MKTLILVTAFCFAAFYSFAQNLVSNPSFEQHSFCPNTLDQVDSCLGWHNFGNSPDYFDACGTPGLSVPNTTLGYQYPRSGNAMCGAIFCYKPTPDTREFIGTQLIQPLKKDTTYFISFYINKTQGQSYTLGSNKIGAKFSNTVYSANIPPALTNTAHVYTDSIVKDTAGWFHMKGSFVADSNYQYLIIGNFFDDAHTDTSGFGVFPLVAYYFIDDVCVSADSTTCYGNIEKIEEAVVNNIKIFPNPANEFLIIKSDKELILEINIYNMTGLCVYSDKERNYQNEHVINSRAFMRGIYTVQILTKKRVVTKSIIINHN